MKTILICDDDHILLKVVEKKLTNDGYNVITCNNGKEAIDIITEMMPDLVLTDMHMPFVTGMELIDYIRNDIEKEIPIIVFTKDTSDETELDAYDLGADDFLKKPVQPDVLSIKVKKALK